MANTYSLISSTTLSASTSSVSFSSIPATYTDLIVKLSARSDFASTSDGILIKFNSTTTNYSETELQGNGTTPTSARYTTLTAIYGLANASTSTSNTFSSLELYVPSYTVSQNKPSSVIMSVEDNTTTAVTRATAGLWSNTAAITTISFAPSSGPNFVSGSSFYLYGIKNS